MLTQNWTDTFTGVIIWDAGRGGGGVGVIEILINCKVYRNIPQCLVCLWCAVLCSVPCSVLGGIAFQRLEI